MDHSSAPAYGLWSLVLINSFIFIFFTFSFFKPRTKTDWRTFSAFSAFIVALFVEMYGFPLTIYLMSGWLGERYPQLNLYTHDSGHLLNTLLGVKSTSHFDVVHILSNVLIVAGFFLLSTAWRVLYKAQQTKTLAVSGAYHYIRHPQYVAFSLIMIGFLVQWPTIPTLVMFPILEFMYVRLSIKEERAVALEFGETYRKYAEQTPRFFPHFRSFAGSRTFSGQVGKL
jgi:protein-S-isoprenylcysteine O-methyltransferase Ste14